MDICVRSDNAPCEGLADKVVPVVGADKDFEAAGDGLEFLHVVVHRCAPEEFAVDMQVGRLAGLRELDLAVVLQLEILDVEFARRNDERSVVADGDGPVFDAFFKSQGFAVAYVDRLTFFLESEQVDNGREFFVEFGHGAVDNLATNEVPVDGGVLCVRQRGCCRR